MPDSVREHTYWSSLALAYAGLGPPLKPTRADIAYMESVVAAAGARHPGRQLRALMLGVTPPVAEMKWPRGAIIRAVDSSLPMIQNVWPGNLPRRRSAVCADWRALPLRKSCLDIVIGDGSLACIPYPHGLRSVVAEARRVLRDDGLLVVRAYVQPAQRERPEDVVADLVRGDIPSFNWFKFRIFMALQESTELGIGLDATYRFWESQQIDQAALIAKTGWDPGAVRMIDLYRGKDTVHAFPTIAELRSVLSEFFDETAMSAPPQTVKECCPIIVAAPRANQRRERKAAGLSTCSP